MLWYNLQTSVYPVPNRQGPKPGRAPGQQGVINNAGARFFAGILGSLAQLEDAQMELTRSELLHELT